ncbi:MAG: uncharacterized protein JWQ44_2807 [Chthoniobacter sp.]|nr:uncharacterized protein [Chthoniobacter sp.]
MPDANLEAVRKLATDLRTAEPRSPRDELGGYRLAARTLDKCRASLVGWNGEYEFNCPMDRQFFAATSIDAEEFKAVVASGATDDAVASWIQEHARGSAT